MWRRRYLSFYQANKSFLQVVLCFVITYLTFRVESRPYDDYRELLRSTLHPTATFSFNNASGPATFLLTDDEYVSEQNVIPNGDAEIAQNELQIWNSHNFPLISFWHPSWGYETLSALNGQSSFRFTTPFVSSNGNLFFASKPLLLIPNQSYNVQAVIKSDGTSTLSLSIVCDVSIFSSDIIEVIPKTEFRAGVASKVIGVLTVPPVCNSAYLRMSFFKVPHNDCKFLMDEIRITRGLLNTSLPTTTSAKHFDGVGSSNPPSVISGPELCDGCGPFLRFINTGKYNNMEYIRLGTYTPIMTYDFSVTMVVSIHNVSQSGKTHLICKASVGIIGGLLHYDNSDGSFAFTLNGLLRVSAKPQPARAYFVAGVYNSTAGTFTIYANEAVATSGNTFSLPFTDYQLTLGPYENFFQPTSNVVDMDEIVLFDRVLTPTEINTTRCTLFPISCGAYPPSTFDPNATTPTPPPVFDLVPTYFPIITPPCPPHSPQVECDSCEEGIWLRCVLPRDVTSTFPLESIFIESIIMRIQSMFEVGLDEEWVQ